MWPYLAAGFELCACLLASAHALLNKRDYRAAALWLGSIWCLPLVGPALYLIFGVNRIRRRAASLGLKSAAVRPAPADLGEPEQAAATQLRLLAKVVSRIVARPLTDGNSIEPLVNGDAAFPAMLAAIESAQRCVSLCSYIFDNDATGVEFAAALERAMERGVQVRVLVDAAGARYSWPPITHRLRRAKIPYARFLPTPLFAPWRVGTINLRNHRKSLMVDGRVAFTGGMNIRHGNRLSLKPPHPVQDLHFRLTGPIVAELQAAFATDWAFTTQESLAGEPWFPDPACSGGIAARVVTDGPDADFDKLRLTLLAALAAAEGSVKILTPYFLPDGALISALNLAALRGVEVDIVLPAKGNLPFVDWASRALWWQVLERGCRIWLTPAPFDHSKLMIVDGHWVFLGSANWDARSLRLNFEMNVEAYGREFAGVMEKIVARKIALARPVSLADADARSLPARLRDATARLFSAYI
jgi:cardiolipin synthase